MQRHLASMAAVAGILAITTNAAFSQQLIDRYEAVIGKEDRVNSKGVPLSGLAAFLRQDRANFHRFGIRQSGDTQDSYFSNPANRETFPALVNNGILEPDAVQAIIGGTMQPLIVYIYGRNGRADSLRVALKVVEGDQTPSAGGVDSTGRKRLSDVQKRLNELGFATGNSDGFPEQKTTDAIAAFQKSLGLRSSGRLDSRTLSRLLAGQPNRAASNVDIVASQQQSSIQASDATDPQVSPAQAVGPYGLWYASSACKRNRGDLNFEVELTVSPGTQDDGVPYVAKVIASSDESMGSGTWEIDYVGEGDPSAPEHLRFFRKRVKRGSLGSFNAESFVFSTTDRRAIFADKNCAPFMAIKQNSASPRMNPTSVTPGNGGTYWKANSERDRCEVAIAWTERLTQEYPGRDFFRRNQEGDAWRKVRLLADDDFVPVFGTPYDLMPHPKRREIDNQVKRCSANPFTRDRMEPYQVIRRFLDGNPEQELTTEGYSSAVFAIRATRAARNRIKDLFAEMSSGISLSEALSKTKAVVAEIEKNKEKLIWPSEFKNLLDDVNAQLRVLGQATLEQGMERINSETDDSKKLELVGELAKEERLENYVPAQTWISAVAQLDEIKKVSSANIVAPWISAAEQAPDGLSGAMEIQVLIDRELPKIAVVGQEISIGYLDALKAQRDSRLQSAIDLEVAAFSNFSSDKAGLDASRQWLASFEASFANFAKLPQFEAALAEHRNNRTKLLESALDAFIAEVKIAEPAERKAVLQSYLSLKSDWKEPIALEYQLFAN
ncbi:peptidoglycan-binding domain-containing protein [Agrobacterium sp. ES01]|uniref:peptidoglycan-binding domain-containing protein n=1 Tax=Agrobacterium sp. ES01 TaxID=3420714 RepID=UPI003D0B500C